MVLDLKLRCLFQDPNADTEWNDILRAKGIIPEKEKGIDENDIVSMLEETVQKKSEGDVKLQSLTSFLALSQCSLCQQSFLNFP